MKQLTCIVCPNGCRISAEHVGGRYVFTGNKCPRGADFAQTELTAPVRSVTTTVRTVFDDMPVLPVRTKGEIPKALIPELLRTLNGITVTCRTGIGEIIAADISGAGVDIIATSDMLNSSVEGGTSHARAACPDRGFGDAKRQGDSDGQSGYDPL